MRMHLLETAVDALKMSSISWSIVMSTSFLTATFLCRASTWAFTQSENLSWRTVAHTLASHYFGTFGYAEGLWGPQWGCD